MFWFYTIIQAIVFDANNFCYRISQLTQLTSLERFDQMNYAGQREESLQQIVSILREESLTLQCCKLSLVFTTIMQSSRICPNRIHASTVKIWLIAKWMLWIYMISVIAKDKSRSSASKKIFLKTIYSWLRLKSAASKVSVKQETACYIWRCDGKVVSATVCSARTRIEPVTSNGCNKVAPVRASTTSA